MIDADGAVLGVYRKTHIPMIIFIRKNFILNLAIMGLEYGKQLLGKLELEFVGINGSQKQHVLLR
jgi:hypothetical protein